MVYELLFWEKFMNKNLPSQVYKPFAIKRPEFDARLPQAGIKRQTVIRGSTKRCQWCSSLLPLNDGQCPTCGASQIDIGLLDLKEAPAWKKRIKGLGGNPNRGYNG